MKKEMTFAPLLLAGLLLSACGHSPAEKTSPYADISLGEFPASRDVAKSIPVEKYEEIIMTKEVSVENRKDGQVIRKARTEPYRLGLQAVATPVFNADGTSKMVLKGTLSCIPRQYSPSSDSQVSAHLARTNDFIMVTLTRTYNFVLETKAYPGDRLAVRTEACTKDTKELPVMLLKEVLPND